jgi:hypothetical protein
LAGGTHQQADDGREQVGRNGKPRPLGDVVDLAHDLDSVARPDDPRQHVCKPGVCSLERRWNQPRGNDGRLHQPEIVIAEIEQLFEAVDVFAGIQIDTRQAEDGLGDHPQP